MMQFHTTRNTEKNWDFNSSVQHFPSNTIDKASTVSGKSMLRRELIITVTCWVNRIWVMDQHALTYDPSPKVTYLTHDPLPALDLTR